jgi:predicted Zn-dependent protease with MMP-like domain
MKISRKSFDRLVEQAIASLPEEFARWIDEVPIIVEDAPPRRGRDQNDSDDSQVLGFFHGTALPDMEENSGRLPPRILLFRRPLMEACNTRAALAEEIRKTLLHELGHYAGMDEEQLEQLGYGPLEEKVKDIEWDVDEGEDG